MFRKQQAELRQALEATSGTDLPMKFRAAEVLIRRSDEDLERTRFALDVYLHSPSGIVYERPRHIFARAWLEVLDAAMRGIISKVCGYCGLPFAPRRSDQSYCPGRPCQRLAFRQRYDRQPFRRAYQRMYKRWKRGTITPAAWKAWKRDNQPESYKET
jgi:hypothetical protein